MTVYRIVSSKYSKKLIASGFAARWNSNGVYIIYTASTRSLACLENIVHRNKRQLMIQYDVVSILIADKIKIEKINLSDLDSGWFEFGETAYEKCRKLGDKWAIRNTSAILEVPSAIIKDEKNYLINVKHTDFKKIKIISSEPFFFDARIK